MVQGQSRKLILLIDDDELVRRYIRTVIEPTGCIVHEASNGREGLTRIAQSVPDAVVIDILMPDKDGIETILELRRDYPKLPIIAISGGGHSSNWDFLRMAERLGANYTLAKPFRPAELLKVLSDVFADGPGSRTSSS